MEDNEFPGTEIKIQAQFKLVGGSTENWGFAMIKLSVIWWRVKFSLWEKNDLGSWLTWKYVLGRGSWRRKVSAFIENSSGQICHLKYLSPQKVLRGGDFRIAVWKLRVGNTIEFELVSKLRRAERWGVYLVLKEEDKTK